MQYGLPYKGSKNFIAEWVVSHFPDKTNFYDLFAGGCGVTHAALLKKNFQHYFVNDILEVPRLFVDAINEKYKNERRWISREDFFKLKDSDLYVRYCWSFGNDGRSYLYGQEIEPYKKACHYAIVFDEWELLKKMCPEVWEVAFDAMHKEKDIKQRRLKFAPAIVKELKRLNDWDLVQNNPLYKSCQFKGNKQLPKLQSLQSLERLERLQSLGRLESLESLQRVIVSQKSYADIEIFPDSLIYCDIPYKNTNGYDNKNNKSSFDYDLFYSWCLKQKEPLIISEYNMPEGDFIELDQRKKQNTLSATANNTVIEKLYIPRTQKDLWPKKEKFIQLDLF